MNFWLFILGTYTVWKLLMEFAENAETGQFSFLIMLLLSYFTCSRRHPFLSYDVITNFFKWQPPLFSSLSDRPAYYLNYELKNLVTYITIFLRKWQIWLQNFNIIFNVFNFFSMWLFKIEDLLSRWNGTN
jgi:hypothetical protein